MPLSPQDASRLTREICALAPIVPVLVIDDASHAAPLAEALVAGGLPALEVTLRTPAALDAIRVMAEVPGGHVGAGTFQPVKVDNINDHHMHAEYVEVPQEVVDAINTTKARGGRIIAVGTTSVRSLESAAQDAIKKGTELVPFFGDTEIFIYPGYEYQLVDCLITNFHLPESTLIMLVSAFAGYENTMNAYKHAVENNYRFFSYGDSMFIKKKTV